MSVKAEGSKGVLPEWGKVLVVGGTDWPQLGRKATGGGKQINEEAPDLVTPHILRSLSNIPMRRVVTSHSGCHVLFLSATGDVFALGRNEKGQLGLPLTLDPSVGPGQSGPVIWSPLKLDRSRHFSPPLPKGQDGDIVGGACGRAHSLLVTRSGALYASGNNTNGQCGLPVEREYAQFTRVEGAFIKEKDPIVQVSAGITFSLLLTKGGKVYAVGSSEKGQLGNGKTGEHFVTGNKTAFVTHTEPLLVKALAEKNIVQISCGQQHSIVMDDAGFVWVWGFGGYGRLGLGTQQDQLTPTLVLQFARENDFSRAAFVVAGPSASAIIDRQRMYHLAGKWKTSGDGGAGQGYMTFRYFHELMGCKMKRAAFGGVTLFCVAEENEPTLAAEAHRPTMNIVWGQNAANGELGLGVGKPKSATKPMRCDPLDNIAILDIGAGQNTTFFIARNQGPTYSELPRFPEFVESSDACHVCHVVESAKGPDDALLECEKCEEPYHLACLRPALASIPEGEWFCPRCSSEAPQDPPPTFDDAPSAGGNKRGASAAGGGDDDEDDEDASPSKKGGAGRKKRKA